MNDVCWCSGSRGERLTDIGPGVALPGLSGVSVGGTSEGIGQGALLSGRGLLET